MSCVPTKEAQALGLVRTEEVQAVYKMPADNQPGDAVVELKFGNKEYTLHEGPAASGSRYVTSDALSPRHQGFSWHSKRNEAIIAGLVPASGVNEVVKGTRQRPGPDEDLHAESAPASQLRKAGSAAETRSATARCSSLSAGRKTGDQTDPGNCGSDGQRPMMCQCRCGTWLPKLARFTLAGRK